MTLTVIDFGDKGIRFERRGDRVWVNLTDMAKATEKLVNDYTRLNATTRFLTEFETITGFPVIESRVGGIGIPDNQRGTWAIEEVAIDFAAWCSVGFRIWVSQQIRVLMTEGTVSIAGIPALPQTYIQALKCLLESEEEKERLRVQNELQSAEIDDLEADVKKFSDLADESFTHSSIIRIAKLNRVSEKLYQWRKLKAATKIKGLEIVVAPCPRFGTKNLYPREAWAIAYPDAVLPENPHAGLVKN